MLHQGWVGRGLRVLVLLCCSLGAASSYAAWGVEQLMQQLAKATPGKATFEERKYLAVLDQPVVSSGELSYTPPGRLEKRTLKPKPESMVVEGDKVTIERHFRERVVRMQDSAELMAFVESIRATLAGDQATLDRMYTLQLQGQAAQWTLTLTPREARMRALVQQIVITGQQAQLRSFEVLQADKDRSVMTITPAAP